VLPEVPVPESFAHRAIVELLTALLRAWVARTGRSAPVAENLAFRWDERRPAVGIDPDVCLIEPAPAEDPYELQSLFFWAPGHSAPRLAVEVVSRNHSYKDYDVVPDKYAASGVGELWIFDHELAGPRTRGGPQRLRLWTRDEDGSFVRRYAGDAPLYSPALGAWAFASEGERRLRIADDEACTMPWLTAHERSAEKETERAAKETARAAERRALARVAELETELAGLKR
jgi:Uma2 family endonuclease